MFHVFRAASPSRKHFLFINPGFSFSKLCHIPLKAQVFLSYALGLFTQGTSAKQIFNRNYSLNWWSTSSWIPSAFFICRNRNCICPRGRKGIPQEFLGEEQETNQKAPLGMNYLSFATKNFRSWGCQGRVWCCQPGMSSAVHPTRLQNKHSGGGWELVDGGKEKCRRRLEDLPQQQNRS